MVAAAHEPSKPLPFHATSTSSPTCQRGFSATSAKASSHEAGRLDMTTFVSGGAHIGDLAPELAAAAPRCAEPRRGAGRFERLAGRTCSGSGWGQSSD